MRRLLGTAVLLPLAALAWGAEADRHNTLTAREAADGWLLLFDGETTFGWATDGGAKVTEGTLLLGENKKVFAWFTTAFGDCEFDFQYRLEGTGQAFRHHRRHPLPDPGEGLVRATEVGWYRCVVKARREGAGGNT